MPNIVPLDDTVRQPQVLTGAPNEDIFALPRVTFDHRYLLATIRSNLLLIAAIIGVALAAAVALTLLETPRYTATSTIQINDSSSSVLGNKSGDQGDDGSNGGGFDTDRYLQTQIDVLQSRGLAVRVAQKLKLDSSARFFAAQNADLPPASAPALEVRNQVVQMLLLHLHVTLPRDSRIIAIDYESTDPAMSADIANAYASEFIQANLQRRYDSSSYARDFVSNQLSETKQKLEDSERALNDYARKSGLIQTHDTTGGDKGSQNGGSVTTDSLLQLNQASNDATAKRIIAQGRWNAINSGPLFSSAEVVANPTMVALLTQRATIETQLEEEQARHLDAYPAVKAKQDELAGINRQLQQVATNIRTSIKADYDAARDSEKQLSGEVERLKGATLSEQDSNVQYGLLGREVDTNRQLYDGLLQRYKDLNASSGISLSNISIIDTADPPVSPTSPNLLKNLLLGLVIGLAIAVATLFLKDQFDDSIRVPEDIETKLGLALLGIIPRAQGVSPEEAMVDPKSSIAEAYNSLRGSLLYATTEGLPQVMLITSAQPSEGKSTVSYAMALGFARMGKTVVLFDADLRRPSLHQRIGYNNERGLSTLLTSHDTLASAARHSELANLDLVPSGPVPLSPTELLSGPRLEQILQEAAADYDVVLIDSPPILGLADAPTMAGLVDGVLFVVEADRGRRGALKMALRRLRAMRPVLLGAVLTKFDSLKAGNRYSEYYGDKYYQYDAAAKS